MSHGKYHLNLVFFAPGFAVVIAAGVCFYCLSGYAVIRWCIGISIGLIEIKRIWKRRAFF